MPTKNSMTYKIVLLLNDIFVITTSFVVAYILRVQYDNRPLIEPVYAMEFFSSVLAILPLWIIVFSFLGLYSVHTYTRRLLEWSRVVVGVFIGILLVIGWEYVSSSQIFPARLVVVYAFFMSLSALLVSREVIRQTRNILYKNGLGVSRVLIVGNSNATTDIASSLDGDTRSGYEVVAFAGPKHLLPKTTNARHFSNLDSALKAVDKMRISAIIQTDLYSSEKRNQKILGKAQTTHIQYNFIPGEPEFYTGKNTVDVFLGYPMITVHQTPLTGWGSVFKRIFDVVVSFVLIVLLLPFFIIIGIIQKITDSGPILYISDRLSKFSKPIRLLKFRSMDSQFGKKDASLEFLDMGYKDLAKEYEIHRKVKNDPRITKFGAFLRKTSLDELPQLFNVLKGDLSLVGPRPILPQEVKFGEGKAALLHSVKSGVTGLWQVSGRSNLSFDERIELELYYAQNWSFWLDVKILFKTILVVINKKGAE